MKNIITSAVTLVMLASFGGSAMAGVVDPLHIVGDYKCTGFDGHDGAFTGALTFTLDEGASQFKNSFGAYRFTLKAEVGGVPATYSGYAAAQGQALAMYFANDSEQAPTDRGVGLALITHDQDGGGNYVTTLHKSYYFPDYMRNTKDGNDSGGRGTEVCTKVVMR